VGVGIEIQKIERLSGGFGPSLPLKTQLYTLIQKTAPLGHYYFLQYLCFLLAEVNNYFIVVTTKKKLSYR